MNKIGIIYGSQTGNTKQLAQLIHRGLIYDFDDVEIHNVSDWPDFDLMDYDIIIAGSSTWGEGDLQEDFSTFVDKIDDADLSGKAIIAFGTGDKLEFPDSYCEAVDLVENIFMELGARKILNGIKVDDLEIDNDKLVDSHIQKIVNAIM